MTVAEARSDARLGCYYPRSVRIPLEEGFLRITVPAEQSRLPQAKRAPPSGLSDEPPYWVKVWPSSLAAVWALARGERAARPLASMKLLDLGCGLGLPGVVAARRGAAVTFWDREPDALAFVAWNATRLASAGAIFDTVCGDWRELSLDRRFDVIVLADVSYRLANHEALLARVEGCLAPGGLVLHADPEREESSLFLAKLADKMPVAQGHHPIVVDKKSTLVRLAVAGAQAGIAGAWTQQLGLAPASSKRA